MAFVPKFLFNLGTYIVPLSNRNFKGMRYSLFEEIVETKNGSIVSINSSNKEVSSLFEVKLIYEQYSK